MEYLPITMIMWWGELYWVIGMVELGWPHAVLKKIVVCIHHVWFQRVGAVSPRFGLFQDNYGQLMVDGLLLDMF